MRLPIFEIDPSPSALWFSNLGPDMREWAAQSPRLWARICGSAARGARMYRDAKDTGQMRIMELRIADKPNEFGDSVFCTVQYARDGLACSAMAGRIVGTRIIWSVYAD